MDENELPPNRIRDEAAARGEEPRGMAAADALSDHMTESLSDIPLIIKQMAPDELEAVNLPREFHQLSPQEKAAAVRIRDKARGQTDPAELGRVVGDVAPGPRGGLPEAREDGVIYPNEDEDLGRENRASDAEIREAQNRGQIPDRNETAGPADDRDNGDDDDEDATRDAPEDDNADGDDNPETSGPVVVSNEPADQGGEFAQPDVAAEQREQENETPEGGPQR